MLYDHKHNQRKENLKKKKASSAKRGKVTYEPTHDWLALHLIDVESYICVLIGNSTLLYCFNLL